LIDGWIRTGEIGSDHHAITDEKEDELRFFGQYLMELIASVLPIPGVDDCGSGLPTEITDIGL
jgi:hypothetical protein